jgi:phospho-N-acetylmuramoyl-pentapeptide-transferase
MFEIIKESFNALFFSIIASALFAPVMIGFMYKFKQTVEIKASKAGIDGKSNTLFRKIMNVEETNGTPNMGGVLILIVVPIITALTMEITTSLQILLIGFILFGFWGLVDVVFTNSIKKNEKLKALQETFEWRLGKLAIAVLLNVGVTWLLYKSGLLPEVNIWQGISIAFTPIMVPVLALVNQFAVYANELTDGADGLMIGIMGIVFSSIAILLAIQGNYTFLPFIAVCIGTIIVDLYFNIPPARFWNGGPGAMPLGFAAFYICLMTGNLLPYFFISLITWGILASSVIQILSVKFFQRRVFKIAPIHHHFQAIGWPSYKVVMRFWLFTIFTSLIGIYIGLFL